MLHLGIILVLWLIQLLLKKLQSLIVLFIIIWINYIIEIV